jgi:hypothetical protein
MSLRRGLRQLGLLLPVVIAIAVALVNPPWSANAGGVLAVVVDVSESFPRELRAAAMRDVEEAIDGLPRGSTVAFFGVATEPILLGFAPATRKPRWIEPTGPADLQGITDLGRGIERTAEFVLSAGGGSILLITDGIDIAGNGLAAAAAVAKRGVDVHVMPIESHRRPEVAVEALRIPGIVRPDQVFQATALIRSTIDQEIRVSLQMDGETIATRDTRVLAGASQAVGFLARAGGIPGTLAALVHADRDHDQGNNMGLAPLAVSGAARVGAVGYDGPLGPGVERWETLPSSDLLEQYDAILVRLDDTLRLSTAQQERLAVHVRRGRGLLVACSDPEIASTLRGGPLEDVLPIRLEPPRLDGDEAAIVILMDRSGSMARTDGGSHPLSLAARGVQELAGLMGPGDRYGLIAFDEQPHVVRPLGPADDAGRDADPLANLVAAGGTGWSGSLDLALEWLEDEAVRYRHIVLVSDGQLAPGAPDTPSRNWPPGVTLSTVAIGDDTDAEALRRLSARYGGHHHRLQRYEELPVALRREAADLRLPKVRSGPLTVLPEDPFQGLLEPGTIPAKSRTLVVAARKGAEVAMRTEEGDPILAFGTAGWGRAAFLATDLQGLTGQSGSQRAEVTLLEVAISRIAAIPRSDTTAPSVTASRGRAEVEWLFESEETVLPDARVRFPSGATRTYPLKVASPGRARTEFLTPDVGEYLVEIGGVRRSVMVSVPPERSALQDDPDWARRLAVAGGGRVVPRSGRVTLPDVRRRETNHAAAPWLISFAALLILADAVIRREE